MPSFGQYQASLRLHVSGTGTLYAIPADGKKAVKALYVPGEMWAAGRRREEVDAFLLQAKTQRALARSSKHWAGVHEICGVREAGGAAAYVVVERYERSLQTILEGRVQVSNDDLRNLFTGIIEGLRDIRALAHRAHGNLKAANILLAGSGDLSQAGVYLSDPAPDGALWAGSEAKDFSDLAKILYHLVNHRAYEGGTIPRTKEWDRLGPNGEDWRKLCNTLLNADQVVGETRDLEKLLGVIDGWRAKPRGSRVPLVAASVFLVLVGGAIAVYFFNRAPRIDFDQARWEKLCLSYHAWFGDFVERMDPAARKKFSAAPYPPQVVKLLDAAGSKLEDYAPHRLAKIPQSAKDLAMSPTDAAKTGGAPWYTKKGVELIDNVSAALTPAQWPLLNSLDRTAATYEGRGWLRPAAGIRNLVQGAQPPALPDAGLPIAQRAAKTRQADVLAGIEGTVEASSEVAEIEGRWTHIAGEIQQLQGFDVPILKVLPQFAEELPRSAAAVGEGATLADVQALGPLFGKMEGVLTPLLAELQRKDQRIVFAELARDPGAQVPAGGRVTLENYAALPEIARGYVEMAHDPRAAVAWDKGLEHVQKDAIEVMAEANPGDANLAALKSRREKLAGQVAELESIAAIEKNRGRIEGLVAEDSAALAGLTHDAETWVAPYIINPAEYLAKERANLTGSALAKGTPVVYEQWKKAAGALLEKISAAPEELKKYRVYKAVDGKFAALEKIYRDFDGEIPAAVAGLAEFQGDSWQHAVAARVETFYRAQALVDLMTGPTLRWADDLPQVGDGEYQAFVRRRLGQFEEIRKAAVAIIQTYALMESRFEQLELLPNEPKAGDLSWRDLMGQWPVGRGDKSPLLADREIVAALKPISERAAGLLALDGVGDYAGLLGRAMSASPEIALTAWRKLGAAPIAENVAVLEDEDKIEAHLAELLAQSKVLAAGRSAALAGEMAGQRPVRWHRYARVLTSAGTIQAALERRGSFNASLSPQSDAPLIFDEALYTLRKQFEQNPVEAQVKAAATQFIRSVQAMPEGIRSDAAIGALLARIAKPLAATQEESSSQGAGPKLAGWEQDASGNPDLRIFYFPNKAAPRFTLEFVRLAVGDKSIYLCTTEMSFGLFAQVVNSSNRFADLVDAGKSAALAHWFKVSADPWDGPRVWKISQKQFVVNDEWLFKTPQMGDDSYYPAGAAPRKPTADDPMQQLTPWAAVYVARLLGCRLPSSQEWEAAYEKFERTGAKDAWNLRGSGFVAQQQYSQKMAAKGMQFPDQGIFLSADQLFSGITAESAKPWTGAALAKLAPNRITSGAGAYGTSQIWFRPVKAQAGAMCDLVGNVAEYVLDVSPAIIKDAAPTVESVNASLAANSRSVFVIGGSSLSPPEIPFNEKQTVDLDFAQTSTGFSDVGLRLAYTAPIESIADVLASVFKAPPYLAANKAPTGH